MPTAKALYFVKDQFLGQSEFESQYCSPDSLLYVCLTCGEVWGRVVVEWCGELALWQVEPTPCHKHEPVGVPDWGKLPGSFCTNIDSSKTGLSVMWWARAIEHLPTAVLQREIQLLLNNYDERLQDATNRNHPDATKG